MTDLETIETMLHRAQRPFRTERPSDLEIIVVTLSGDHGQGDRGAMADFRFNLDGSLREVEVWNGET